MIITVQTFADCVKVSEVVQNLWEMKGPQEVEIRNPKKDRSRHQNALYWKWLSVIASETGSTKEEMHDHYKERFLLGIFARDDEGYAEMSTAIKAVKSENPAAYAAIKKQVISLTSTTDCTVQQMTEYLNRVKGHAQSMQIVLPLPEMEGLL